MQIKRLLDAGSSLVNSESGSHEKLLWRYLNVGHSHLLEVTLFECWTQSLAVNQEVNRP